MTSRLRRLRAPAAVIAGFVVAGIVLEKANAFPLLRVALNRTPGRIPSTLVLPRDDLDRRVSTVSLYVPNRDLYDLDTGILSHKLQHGRQWERQGWISFFERGQLTFGGSAGVRVHGGGSRTISWPQSFRLYFRKQYGTAALPGAVAFGGDHTHALKRLILHNDMRPWQSMDNRSHLINPLAYDIARAMSNITPETRPVRFYLNGTFQGVYVLTEHFDVRDFFEPHAGRRAYMNDDQLDRLWSEVQNLTPLRMRTIAPLVDIDNLTRWFIAMVFCGTLDAYQGPGQFYQPERTPAPWFWVTWDMDHSFQLEALDSFAGLLEAPGQRPGRRANEPRPRILTTLLRDDPAVPGVFQDRLGRTDELRGHPRLRARAFRVLRGPESRAGCARLGVSAEGPPVPRAPPGDHQGTCGALAWNRAHASSTSLVWWTIVHGRWPRRRIRLGGLLLSRYVRSRVGDGNRRYPTSALACQRSARERFGGRYPDGSRYGDPGGPGLRASSTLRRR